MSGRGREDGLGLLSNLIQYLFEWKLEQLVTAVFEYKETHFEDWLPAWDKEVIPKLEQSFTNKNFLGSFCTFIVTDNLDVFLDRISEDGYEPGGGEVRRIDHFILEVWVEVGLEDRYETVQLVKEEL